MFEEAVLQDGLVWIGSDWYRLVQLIAMFEEAVFQDGLVRIGTD